MNLFEIDPDENLDERPFLDRLNLHSKAYNGEISFSPEERILVERAENTESAMAEWRERAVGAEEKVTKLKSLLGRLKEAKEAAEGKVATAEAETAAAQATAEEAESWMMAIAHNAAAMGGDVKRADKAYDQGRAWDYALHSPKYAY